MGRRQRLGAIVKIHREHKNLSQDDVAKECGVSRTPVAYLEQGFRFPKPELLEKISILLDIPRPEWEPFTLPESLQRFDFEDLLAELVGHTIDIDTHDAATRSTAEYLIVSVFSTNPTEAQLLSTFNSILVYYGVGPVSEGFFRRYFSNSSFGSLEAFGEAIKKYQMDAIRLFSTFGEAFETLNGAQDLNQALAPIQSRSLASYQNRTDWTLIEQIDDEYLPDLGYISAQRVRQETAERSWLIAQLRSRANDMKKDTAPKLGAMSVKTQRKIDSLLRKFNSTIIHGVSSPLFQPDADALTREAERLAPRTEDELARMERTQQTALRNLSRYLSADYMDVYVATSMRTPADYVSVNHFVNALFKNPRIRPLKLRYFNPTQSWIDDRVAKGLVEALMLKRASVTIYMAQKTDTFGKDSEASVALGQGKPVVVYVPKLSLAEARTDSEELFSLNRTELVQRFKNEVSDEDVDDTMDDEALVAGLLKARIIEQPDEAIRECVRQCWADFDLYSEAARLDSELREPYRQWLDSVVTHGREEAIPEQIREPLIGALVATGINFERRAKLFREVHPLALQVILSSGVLNGILVARTEEQCAEVLEAVVKNTFNLNLRKDEDNYRVVERITGSTVRVISRHDLLRNAFEAHYRAVRFSN